MDSLNQTMRMQQIPHKMRIQLRSYFQHLQHLQRSRAKQHLIQLMSPSLQVRRESAVSMSVSVCVMLALLRHNAIRHSQPSRPSLPATDGVHQYLLLFHLLARRLP